MRRLWCRNGRRTVAVSLVFTAGLLTVIRAAPQDSNPVFRSGVERVTLNVVVRDPHGRPVTDLTRDDFWIMDSGKVTPVTDFRNEDQPISLGLLVDGSGSMQVGYRVDDARQAAQILLDTMRPDFDEAALYTFDKTLHEAQAFTKDVAQFRTTLAAIHPFGMTSIHDAVAAAAQRVVQRGARRAVVVFTDGIDTSSELSASEASEIASGIDVPVYVVAVVSPLDHAGDKNAVVEAGTSDLTGDLADLARWTGGALFIASTPDQVTAAVREILADLRQAYLVAFEPSSRPGWHRIVVRTLRSGTVVRTRVGFWVGPRRPS